MYFSTFRGEILPLSCRNACIEQGTETKQLLITMIKSIIILLIFSQQSSDLCADLVTCSGI